MQKRHLKNPNDILSWQNLRKQRIEKIFLNLLMDIYENPTANIKLNGNRLNACLLRSGTNQGCSLSWFLFSLVLRVLTSAIWQEKEIQGIRIRKEEVKLSLFAYLTFYPENLRGSTPKKVLELIIEFSKGARYKINIRKCTMFWYTSKEPSEIEKFSSWDKKRNWKILKTLTIA